MFSDLPIVLAAYNNMRNERAYTAQRGGYFLGSTWLKDKPKVEEIREQYETEWLEADYSVRQLGEDGRPTNVILASGPLEII